MGGLGRGTGHESCCRRRQKAGVECSEVDSVGASNRAWQYARRFVVVNSASVYPQVLLQTLCINEDWRGPEMAQLGTDLMESACTLAAMSIVGTKATFSPERF